LTSRNAESKIPPDVEIPQQGCAMRLRTRVFEVAAAHGFTSDRQLARAMDVDPATISRVKSGEMGVGPEFITGARRAFPDKSLDDLFFVESDDPQAAEPAA
jgi:hypothetical protein